MKKVFQFIKRAAVLCVSAIFCQTISASQTLVRTDLPVSEERFIVIWDKTTARQAQKNTATAKVAFAKASNLRRLPSVDVFKTPRGMSLKEAMKEARKLPGVRAVEPDYLVQALTPNDPDFSLLWGLHNEVADSDVNAPEAWNLTTGSSDVVVAIIDTGIDYNHPDLAANIWNNPGEIPGNGVDDDGNGWIDDVHGIDTANNDGNPLDDQGHGTHVAGTIAGVGNNGIGVTGVAWETQLVACKFLNSSGSGWTSAALTCLDYLLDLKVNKGVNLIVSNNSWGGGAFSQALYEAIAAQRDAGILFVAAAGNSGLNADIIPAYPAAYDLSNIISVAALDQYGELAVFSNYGAESVDIAAPGVEIYSAFYGGGYLYASGTSMAAPHVTGAVALLGDYYPDKSAEEYKNLILSGGRPLPALTGKIATGATLQLWGEGNSGALNCVDQYTSERISPLSTDSSVPYNTTVSLQVRILNCDQPTTAEVLVDIGGLRQITLLDDGQNGDQVAGDGILSGDILVDWVGPASISFPEIGIEPFQLSGTLAPQVDGVGYEYIDITGTALNLNDDEQVKIPVDFPLQAPIGTFNEVWVSENGVISGHSFWAPWFNISLPVFSDKQVAYPWWDDLHPGSAGNHYWEVIGEEPNRKLVIEWRDVTFYGYGFGGMDTSYRVTFQAVLYESEKKIRFNYKDASAASIPYLHLGKSATVGYEHEGSAVQYSFNEARLSDGLSLEILPPPQAVNLDITAFHTAGLARPGLMQTITFTASGSGNESIIKEIDFDDGNGFVPVTGDVVRHRFDEMGQHRLTARATTSQMSVFRVITLDILPFSTEELALMEAIQQEPEPFGLIGQEALAASPQDYGYASLEALAASPQDYGYASLESLAASPQDYGYASLESLAASPQDYGYASLESLAASPQDYGYASLESLAASPQDYGYASLESLAASPQDYGYASLEALAASPQDYGYASLESLAASPQDYGYASLEALAASPQDYGYASLEALAASPQDYGYASLEALVASPQDYGYASLESLAASPQSYGYASLKSLAASPQDYGYASLESLAASPQDYGYASLESLAASPRDYGYAALEGQPLATPESVAAAPPGLHLWAAPFRIDDLERYFSSVRYIWIYGDDGKATGWSPDADKRAEIENSGYELLNSIPAGVGLWVSK